MKKAKKTSRRKRNSSPPPAGWDKEWQKLPQNIKDALFEVHSHAELLNMDNPEQIAYTELDVIALIRKFAHPKWFPKPIKPKHPNTRKKLTKTAL